MSIAHASLSGPGGKKQGKFVVVSSDKQVSLGEYPRVKAQFCLSSLDCDERTCLQWYLTDPGYGVPVGQCSLGCTMTEVSKAVHR